MSFDLYVWGRPSPVSAERADEICALLAEVRPNAVEADPRVASFAQELLARFPALEGLNDAGLEASPWSMTPEQGPGHVIITMGWSSAVETTSVVMSLASAHGLVVFDPQSGRAFNPPGAVVRLEFRDGTIVEDPASADFEELLAGLSDRNWFACLESRPGWFVQVGLGSNAGVSAREYALEVREGDAGGHRRTIVWDFSEIVNAFRAFAAGGIDWQSAHHWTPVELL